MAVVQISRVQVRRGRKNSGTSVPQLASGELGWAVDAQELYIGNGSVSEGAPYVGNTMILTEHTNILDLALQYEYKRNTGLIQTGPSPSLPVQRTFQERLDDQVSVRSFGAIGDGSSYVDSNTGRVVYSGSTNDTSALQRAIDELYLNDASEGSAMSRVELRIPAGIYLIDATLNLPPYAVLKGDGKDKTIIVQTGNFPTCQTVGSTDPAVITPYVGLVDMTVQNQSRFVEVSDLTFVTATNAAPVLMLNASVSSRFNNVKFQGVWVEDDAQTEVNSGVQLLAKTTDITTQDTIFTDCDFSNLSYAVNSTYDVLANTFTNCLFETCGTGVLFGQSIDAAIPGKEIGPRFNKFLDSRFININQHGIKITAGKGNLSSRNTFINVGNDTGTSASAVTPVIYFGDGSNVSQDDYFGRSVDLTNTAEFISSRYISEVAGAVTSDHKFNTQISLSANAVNTTLLRLPGNESSSIKLHYVYRSEANAVMRQGTMYVTVDKFNNQVRLTDEYEVTGNSLRLNSLSFKATFEDLPVPPDVVGDGSKETVVVKYTNDTVSENGYFNYWYEILS